MTPLQTAQVRASDIRVRLSELGGATEVTDEIRSELESLRQEYADVERRSAALLIAEPDRTPIISQTAEGTEYRQMVSRANVGTIFDDLLAHRSTSGVEAELQTHLGMQGNQVPLDMLKGVFEERAVTQAPGQVGQNQQPIIPYVFPMGAAAFLGVAQPTVPVGEAVFSVLTGTLDVGTPAENAVQAETTGSFSASVLTPQSLRASLFYSVEDRARFAGMGEALRQNLNDGLADGLDKEILSGANGLFAGTNLANNNVTANDTFDTYLNNLVWDQIDGRYASMASDLAMVMGAGTYGDTGKTYRNTSVDRSALDRIMELVSGVRVSAHVPAVDSNNRQNVVIKRGMSETATCPVWDGITLVPDEVTKISAGQVVITAYMLYAMKVLRTGAGLVKQQVDHS